MHLKEEGNFRNSGPKLLSDVCCFVFTVLFFISQNVIPSILMSSKSSNLMILLCGSRMWHAYCRFRATILKLVLWFNNNWIILIIFSLFEGDYLSWFLFWFCEYLLVMKNVQTMEPCYRLWFCEGNKRAHHFTQSAHLAKL